MHGEMDKAGLLKLLQELDISCDTIEHRAVMTCEAQAEELHEVAGVLTKNLFLKDKKNRLYLVTAELDTKVDLKALSARLGTGKGGVRMAPDEMMATVLKVPAGSCTPLALCQPTAANVVLFLDQKLQGLNRIFVHPLENTATTALSTKGLEKFLRSLGREPLYVDLEAEPMIDKHNPPDLKAVADATLPYKPEGDAGELAAEQHLKAATNISPPTASKRTAAPAAKPGQKAMPAKPRGDDVTLITDSVIQKVLKTVMGGADAHFDADILRKLTADVSMELNALRNAAYTNGFFAAKGAVAASISKSYA